MLNQPKHLNKNQRVCDRVFYTLIETILLFSTKSKFEMEFENVWMIDNNNN